MNTGGPDTRLIDGRFELLQRLGGGGMGLVWRARDNALHREVALKEVRALDPATEAADPTAARETRERVLREARALARLQHPNVAVIHHIVDSAEHAHPWLVMELVTGGSLADRLARGPLGVQEAARTGRGVLAALRAAHAAGIQHRDVKPANVLLRTDGTPVLTDFGIAAMHDATALTATGSLIGSPEYIAPERIRGEEGNPASDLWSLGMLLYVAVEGHHPLRRATSLATLAAVLDEPLPPPVHSGQLGGLLSAMLARNPAQRPDAATIDRILAAAETATPTPGSPVAGFGGAPAPAETPQYFTGPLTPAHPQPGGQPGGGAYPAQPSNPYSGAPVAGAPYDSGRHDVRPYSSGPYAAPPYDSGPTGNHPYGNSPYPGGPHDILPAGPTGPGRPPAPARRHRGAVVTLSVVAVCLTGLLAWTLWPNGTGTNTKSLDKPPATTAPGTPGTDVSPTGGGSDTSAAPTVKPAAPPAGKQNLLTPDGVRATIDAIRPLMSGTKIKRLVVYPEYAIAEAPTASDPSVYDRITYRDGRTTRTPGATLTSRDKLADLQLYNWDILPDLIKKAEQTLNVANPTSRYLIIGPEIIEEKPSIAVYLSDDYGGGYLSTDVKGTVIRTVPRGA
ncbi:protein kinase [Kitasatospora sp. NBC_00240]|uniref:serine/threonine-protein kinase n=1 Tax=Kitasatospora sp. NBC_00240 TaxID=2903567 RepID=UPI00224E58CD|nr:serine/threonine protein kinase [Kitasatospora sp. NBC_00240]MCX5208026.1 protein kinase [Kitasatospora sp. NBC_00240]